MSLPKSKSGVESMSFELPLESMSLLEKLEAMEAIWADICKQSVDFTSPDWHKDVLETRRQRLQSGQATIDDWITVRKRLQDLGK